MFAWLAYLGNSISLIRFSKLYIKPIRPLKREKLFVPAILIYFSVYVFPSMWLSRPTRFPGIGFDRQNPVEIGHA